MPTPITLRMPPMKTPTRREGRRISRNQWRRQNAARLRKGRAWLRKLTTTYIETEFDRLYRDTRHHASDALAYGLAIHRLEGHKIEPIPFEETLLDVRSVVDGIKQEITGALYLGDLFKACGAKP